MEVTFKLRVKEWDEISERLDQILRNQEKLMAAVDDLKAQLVEANAVTNEIADDLNDLAKRVGEGSLSPTEVAEVSAELNALKDKLKAVAAVHTPPVV